jgi:hypothetical protein
MAAPKEVVVTGVDIPFFSMVWIILKWSLASIPAMILLWLVGAVLVAIGGGIVAAILAAVGVAAENAA